MTAVDELPPLAQEPVVADRPQAGLSHWKTVVRAAAPVGLAIVALLSERFLPNSQFAPPSGLYAGLLTALLGLSIGAAVLQWLPNRFQSTAREKGPLLGGAIVLLMVWNFVTVKMNWLPLPFFPGPDRVLRSLRDDRLMLAVSTFHSLRLLLSGYAVGVVAGIASGILIGWFRSVRYWGMPLLKIVGPIPATAYVPLMMVMFSDQFTSGTVLIAVAVWFPVTMLTASGMANVPLAYLDVARTLGAGPVYLIFKVALPASLPSIFLGMFMGLGAAFLTLIVAETLGVSAGLGWYLKWQQGYLEYANVYAALVIMSLFFSGLMTVLFLIRDRLLSWQKGVIRW